jgi:opacity protein-like surface antigen
MKKRFCWQLGAFLLMSAAMALADEPASAGTVTNLPSLGELFQHGRYESSVTSGALFSPFVATSGRPQLNYTLSELQIGYMLSNVKESGWLRGNFEVAGEGFGGATFDGKGHYLSGITLWLRYNFVPERWRLVPYAQGGAGLTFTDFDRRLVGQTFNFNLGLGVGVRCFVARHWSVNLEYRYQHISNARLARQDLGVNAHGPMLGVSYFF